MTDRNDEVSVYLLIDNGLLQEVSAGYTEADLESRPSWLRPIYAERALQVSPLLIDIEAAYMEGDLDRVMACWNARTPALHVTVIETRLDIEEMSDHLRRFIFISDPDGKQFTLRFADCAVLASLSSVLKPEQWATMRMPIENWKIHDRSGAMVELAPAQTEKIGPTPLCLDRDQLAALDEASEPDHFIAKVNLMRHGLELPGNAAQRYTWAQAARQIWRSQNNSNPTFLLFLTEIAILTSGKILKRTELADFLAMDEVSNFRRRLNDLIHAEK